MEVADLQFVGCADPAVSLDGGLADWPTEPAHLRLEQGDVVRRCAPCLEEGGGVNEARPRLQVGDLHVGESVGHGLEGADGYPELLACEGVLGGAAQQLAHDAHAGALIRGIVDHAIVFLAAEAVDHGWLSYVEAGEGPAMLLVHGLGGNWQNWLTNVETLASRHRVIALDLPGIGRSEPFRGKVSMARYVDVLFELLDKRGVETATLIGNSMGGLLTIEAAAQRPERVDAAILACSAGVPLTHRRYSSALIPFALGLNETFQRGRPRRAVLATPLLRRKIAARMLHAPDDLDQDHLIELLGGLGAAGFGAALRAGAHHDARAQARQMRCPTLVLAGGRDRLLPPWMASQLHDLIPNSTLVVWDDTGHCPMIEHPARFNALVSEFVS